MSLEILRGDEVDSMGSLVLTDSLFYLHDHWQKWLDSDITQALQRASEKESPGAKKMWYKRPDIKSTFLATVIVGIGALRPLDWSHERFPPLLWKVVEISALCGFSCANSKFPGSWSKAGLWVQRMVRGKETSQNLKLRKKKTLLSQQSRSFWRDWVLPFKNQSELKSFIFFFPFLHKEEFTTNEFGS